MVSSRSLAALFFFIALYCAIDPFKISVISDFPNFEATKVEMPPWSELPADRDSQNLLQKSEIRFLNQVQGPESLAFDPQGRGPYTGVADGRILFWNGEVWSDFAYTSSNRSSLCDKKPSPASYFKNEHICGRPLGLRFDKKTGNLYIADAYFGIMKVGPEGGLATSLTTQAEQIPFLFTNDLDIDDDGNIYFTDSSTKYQRRNFMQLGFAADPSGRVMKYDPKTKETIVLIRDLQFPNGLSLSDDHSFFVVCEGAGGRLRKYWLKGEKADTSEVIAILPGYPDNVRKNDKGEFWVAIPYRRTRYSYFYKSHPKIAKFLLRLPIPGIIHGILSIGGNLHAIAAKYDGDGKLLQILEDSQGKVVKAISEIEEKDGKLWMGSVMMPFVAVYNLD